MTQMEQDILSTIQLCMNDSIKKVLTDYNSPLHKLILQVVEINSVELKGIINDAFLATIRTEDFKKSILAAFAHKISRSIINNNDSLFDKVGNELKQDAQFRAKMTLAVAQVVQECMKSKEAQ